MKFVSNSHLALCGALAAGLCLAPRAHGQEPPAPPPTAAPAPAAPVVAAPDVGAGSAPEAEPAATLEPAAPAPEPAPEEAPAPALELMPSVPASAPPAADDDQDAEDADAADGAGDAESDEDPEEEVEEILITGSRVKRTTFSQPSSVQVISRKELEMSGANNMADIIKYMNINSGSEFNTDVAAAAGGTAQFNLRGLGLNSTLVLLNGRRLVNSAAVASDGTNFVDINTIPVALIERVEVLKGGASAIYGSDAVAGVVNIITRKDFDGFEAQIGGQSTDDFDQSEWDMSLIGGARGERTSVTGLLSYFKREPLQASDREFTDNGRNVSLLGQPGAYVLERLNPATGQIMEVSTFTDPRCDDAPLSESVSESTSLLKFCSFDFNPFFQLMMDEERANTYVTVRHDLSDHTHAFFEAGYAAARSFRTLSPSFPLLQPIVVPRLHPYNVTGDDLRWVGRTLGADAGPGTQFFESDTLHSVIGIEGDLGGVASSTFFEDWSWDLAGSYSRNDFSFGLSDTLIDPITEALHCDGSTDPADCWNPFSDGPPNPTALVDKVHGELRTRSRTRLATANAGITGPLFELPGGDFAFALGAQMRHETAESDPDHDANQLNYVFLIGGPDFAAERDILAAYGELVMPFARGLEVQAAGRFEDYQNAGDSFDPKFGVSWTPAATIMGDGQGGAFRRFRLHGTYATSFRAPSLLQMNGAQTEIAETFDVDLMDDTIVRSNRSIYRAVRTRGNPELGPETSTAISAGIEWHPVDELMVELDYFRYDFDDLVVKQSHQQLVDDDFMCTSDPSTCNPNVIRDRSGSVQRIEAAFVNAPNVVTDGIDFNVMYRSDFGGSVGTFTVGSTGTYVRTYEIQVEDGGETIEAAGQRNFGNAARPMPQLRANFPLSWGDDGHSAGLVVHYISGYDNDEVERGAGVAVQEGASRLPPIDAWVTLDLQYAFRLDEGDGAATTFKVGLLNALDADPPELDAGYGYDVYVHDPRGRMLYGRLIQEL